MKTLQPHLSLWRGVVSILLASANASAQESPPPRAPVYQPPVSQIAFESIDLRELSHRLVKELKERHTETDPTDPQFGMIYETQHPRTGRWIDGYARDTMHHTLWTMVALANAFRATEDPEFSNYLFDYPYRFYTNLMRRSDELLGPEYGKGFCPYWWDDGDSYDLVDYNKSLPEPKRMVGFDPQSSIHMAQDQALAHLDLFFLTHDKVWPEITQYLHTQLQTGKVGERYAIERYLREVLGTPRLTRDASKEEQRAYAAKKLQAAEEFRALDPARRQALREKWANPNFGVIVTAVNAHLNPGSNEAPLKNRARKPADEITSVLTNALVERNSKQVDSFCDEQCYDYYLRLIGDGDAVDERYAREFTLFFYSYPYLNEFWMNDGRYEWGMVPFNAMGRHHRLENGKFAEYHSDVRYHVWHSRGLQYTWMTAIALQMMERFPDLHEKLRLRTHPDLPVVRFVDASPTVDGRPDAAYSAPIEFGNVKLAMVTDPLSLFLFIQSDADASIRIHQGETAGDHYADIGITNGVVTVRNSQGKDLLFQAAAGAGGVELQIPYMIYKPQGDWLTGVDHSRQLLEVTGAKSQLVYLLSSHARMKDRLQKDVEGSIANWKATFDNLGYLPYHGRDKGSHPMSELSFSGGYAHLLHAISAYRMWKDGKAHWELMKSVRIKAPEAAPIH